MKRQVIFDKESVESRIAMQFSVLESFIGKECVDILTDRMMTIINDETTDIVDARVIISDVGL